MKLLIAEDDPQVGAGVDKGLRLAGFQVDWCRDGESARLALASGSYQALLLDLGLPRRDGMAVLQWLRASGRTLPVLVVSARDAVTDRIKGLNLGADDYLVKPFSLDELIARVHALLRREAGGGGAEYRSGSLTLNPVTREVRGRDGVVAVSGKEFALLEALMRKPGQVFSIRALEELLYGWNEEVASNAVEVHIHNLRRKLGAGAIRNLRGHGYLAPP